MIEEKNGEPTIRSDETDPCPYGLCISCACRNVGNLVQNMSPVDILGSDTSKEEKYAIKKANEHLLIWNNPKSRCKYADSFFNENDKVILCNCSVQPGTPEHASLSGSPYYYKHFSGIGTDGLYSYPLGYFADNSIDRGMYFGMYSI